LADKAQILVKIGAEMVNKTCAGLTLHGRNGAVQKTKLQGIFVGNELFRIMKIVSLKAADRA
jgi:hypothetical protein